MSRRATFLAPFLAPCLALCLCLTAGRGDAQADLDPDQMRGLAVASLTSGRPVEAMDYAKALIRRDPRDATALIVLAEAAILRGEFGLGRRAAARAYRAAPDDNRRFGAARLAALAHSQLGQDTRAQFWLRRATQFAPNEAAVQSVAEDYRYLRERNPLSVNLSFGIAPSSNINGGSANDTTPLFGLPFDFVLEGAALALSGLQVSAGAQISYRIAGSARDATFIDAALRGRTYVLSDDARRQAPGVEGSDFADIGLGLGVTHRRLFADGSEPVTLRAGLGQTWYDGAPYVRSLELGASRGWQLPDRNRLDLSAQAQWQDRLGDDITFPTYVVQARVTHQRLNGDRIGLSASLRDARTEEPDLGYDGHSIGLRYGLAAPLAGATIGFEAEAEYRDYVRSRFDPEGREDWRGTARIDLGLDTLDWYGFQPVVGIEAARNSSTVGLYDTEELRIDLGVRSSF